MTQMQLLAVCLFILIVHLFSALVHRTALQEARTGLVKFREATSFILSLIAAAAFGYLAVTIILHS